MKEFFIQCKSSCIHHFLKITLVRIYSTHQETMVRDTHKNMLLPGTTRFGHGTSHLWAGHVSMCWKNSLLHCTTIKQEESTQNRFATKWPRYDHLIWWQSCFYAHPILAWPYTVEDFACNSIQRQSVSSSNFIVRHYMEQIDDQKLKCKCLESSATKKASFSKTTCKFFILKFLQCLRLFALFVLSKGCILQHFDNRCHVIFPFTHFHFARPSYTFCFRFVNF